MGRGPLPGTERQPSHRGGHDAGRLEGEGGPAGRFGAHESRSFWTQARDEVSAWLGDEEAARRRRADEDNHTGKGPASYVRSDARLREDVCDVLTDDPVIDARDIEVDVCDGEVTLKGKVRCREDKRRAEDLAERAYGVRHVQNDLRFEEASDSGRGGLVPPP